MQGTRRLLDIHYTVPVRWGVLTYTYVCIFSAGMDKNDLCSISIYVWAGIILCSLSIYVWAGIILCSAPLAISATWFPAQVQYCILYVYNICILYNVYAVKFL